MASVYKRKIGKGFKWRAVVRIKGFPTVSKTVDRKQEAEDWAHDVEREIKSGQFIQSIQKPIYFFTISRSFH
jgi:ABC-type uncharacterized transport system permease subunit